MPWVRIDENAMDHPKIAGLSDGAFRLWCEGLSYCQRYLTDGALPSNMGRVLRCYSAKRHAELVDAGLWAVSSDNAVSVHDYLHWNESRATVMHARDMGKRRVALLRDPDLRERIRGRDGDHCRYCHVPVTWTDRRGPHGGTYDHVDPDQGNTFENLVVCCRGCNSGKGRRTPEQAGMVLRAPFLIGSDSDLDLIKRATSGVHGSSTQLPSSTEREGGAGETTPQMRAGNFCQWYEDAHQRLFHVGYIGTRNDYEAALRLVRKFSDADLRDAAMVWFGQDDDFATRGTRTIPKFASRASDCVIQARKVAS